MNGRFKGGFLGILVTSAVLLAACGGGGGGGGGDDNGGDNGDAALLAELERIFPFTPNQPFDVIYQCERQGSALVYTFNFKSDLTFDLYSTLDTGDDVGPFPGIYTYQDDELHLEVASVFINLDETSTSITPSFGLPVAFQTPSMACLAIGHRENATEFGTTVHYDCPNINLQAVSFDDNAIEFVHRAVPYGLAVPGSAFRARDRYVDDNPSALVRRGYGLYRRAGNDFYIVFLPGTFDDNDVLAAVSGTAICASASISWSRSEVTAAGRFPSRPDIFEKRRFSA